MGFYMHLHVCFACDENEGVAALAKRHLASLPNDGPGTASKDGHWVYAAREFLKSLAWRTGRNPGPKGGLSLWGMIANWCDVAGFCEGLRPFWVDLLSEVDGGPLGFERVIVFEEREGSLAANAYEIGWCNPDDYDLAAPADRGLVITKHECLPFAWRQF